jgi:succinate-semialdehyde dehydrogenase/glutarate-semialdehyde dehydrogenase
VDLAVAGCMASKFRNMGQTCVTSNRIFVQEGIYEKFLSKLKETVEKSLVLGDGMDQGVNQVKATPKHFEIIVTYFNRIEPR